MTDRQTMTGFLLVGALLSLLFLFSLFLEGNSRDIWLEEDGVIESATAWGYFVCVAFMIYKGKLSYLKRHHDLFLLIVFFMLRELDFDKKFTTIGLLKIQFFISNRVPLVEKTIGAIFVLSLVYVVFSILYRYSRDFWVGLKNHSIVSLGALIVVIFLVVSKSLDGISRKLSEFGIEIGDRASMHASAVEEILELGIPMILLLTLIAYFKRNKV